MLFASSSRVGNFNALLILVAMHFVVTALPVQRSMNAANEDLKALLDSFVSMILSQTSME